MEYCLTATRISTDSGMVDVATLKRNSRCSKTTDVLTPGQVHWHKPTNIIPKTCTICVYCCYLSLFNFKKSETRKQTLWTLGLLRQPRWLVSHVTTNWSCDHRLVPVPSPLPVSALHPCSWSRGLSGAIVSTGSPSDSDSDWRNTSPGRAYTCPTPPRPSLSASRPGRANTTRHEPECTDHSLLSSVKAFFFVVPRFKTNIGSRYFTVAAPTLWNSLPNDVKSTNTVMTFHGQLKTYLFKLAYPALKPSTYWPPPHLQHGTAQEDVHHSAGPAKSSMTPSCP